MSNAKPCESFRDARAGAPGSQVFCDVHIEDPGCHHCGAPKSQHADIEACARAAYEESLTAPKRGYHGQALMELEWDSLGPIRQEHWRAIARAVLAAAGVGR